MKPSTRDARALLRRPDPRFVGYLLYGPEPGPVADARDQLLDSIIGDSDAETTRIEGADARRDPGQVHDAMRSMGFFGGRTIISLNAATDGLTAPLDAALEGVDPNDAVLVAAAGSLNARSKLRQLFEKAPHLVAIGVYADPPDRGELADMLSSAGVTLEGDDAMRGLEAFAAALSPGELRALIHKLRLCDQPVTAEALDLAAPASTEGDLDRLLAAVASGKADETPSEYARLRGQGVAPTTIVIALQRRFQMLHAVSTAPGGVEAGLNALRPPLWGPRRSQAQTELRIWRPQRIEQALSLLLQLDLDLRGGRDAPPAALLERALIRLAMLAKR